MQQSIVLNSQKLREVSHASHTAEVTITSIAIRERLRKFSDIQRTRNALIRNGEKIVDADYMAFWQGLEAAGVGVIVKDRVGAAPKRFEWYFSMKKVAQAALEGKDVPAERVTTQTKAAKAPALRTKKVIHMSKASKPFIAPKQAQPRGAEWTVFIPLRKDFDLTLSLPKDISKDEMAKIQQVLSRLSA